MLRLEKLESKSAAIPIDDDAQIFGRKFHAALGAICAFHVAGWRERQRSRRDRMIVIDWLDANKAMDIAAMDAKEKRDAELVNRRTTILRLSEYAYRGAVSWAVDSFADQVEELLKDEGFRDEF